MTGDQLRAHCLSRAGAEETFPFNDEVSVFKVGGKMFALSVLDAGPLTVSVKCDPEEALALRQTYQGVEPGYHLNKKHWNTVECDADVPDADVLTMIDDSYALVAPKASRQR